MSKNLKGRGRIHPTRGLNELSPYLKAKSLWLRKETLLIHREAPETRIASSLSPIEIFVVLYYGGILKFRPQNPGWEGRDRFIISKGHGAVSLYPVLADLGYFAREELAKVCKEGSCLGGIPDPNVPGFETVNGSLGQGLGTACGMALALKRKGRNESVFCLLGDGELCEGSVWEAIMFAGEHKLDNLVAIVDSNKASMLGYCKDIIDLSPLVKKFEAFGWKGEEEDGHNAGKLLGVLRKLKRERKGKPKVLVANTIKGKGVPGLEKDPLSHVRSLKKEEVDAVISQMLPIRIQK